MPNYTHDHEITVDSTTKRVNLVRDANGQAMFSVIEDVPEYRNGVLFAQNDWTHGHGQYSVADTQAYFDGEAIDTTQEGRVILGPRINEVWTGAVQKQYYTTGQDASGAVYDVNWFAQTFTPADTHTVTAVKLYLKKNNVENTPGTITVSIRATSSSKPTGSDLCVATYDGNNLPTSYGWIPFVFCPGVSLTISTKYAIVLRAPNADTTNQVSWGHDESTPSYTGGARSGSTDSGVTWGSEETSIDCLFDEYAAGDTALDTAPVCFLWSPTASKLLCATSGKIYYYNGITWTAATTTVAGVVDLKEYNGKIYAACGSGDNFWYSTDADTWTECTLTDHHAVKFLSAPNAAGTANVFWKLMTANELTSSTNPVNSGTEFTTPAYIGDTTSNVTNIFLFNDELMVGRQDNLYNYDNAGGIHALMNELMHARSTNNFKYVVNFQSGVYFSLGTKVGELIGTSPGVFSDVSPLSNTGDIDKVGVCVGITSDTDYLYVAMLEGTRTHIYKGRKTASG